jgi:hypothetical protein
MKITHSRWEGDRCASDKHIMKKQYLFGILLALAMPCFGQVSINERDVSKLPQVTTLGNGAWFPFVIPPGGKGSGRKIAWQDQLNSITTQMENAFQSKLTISGSITIGTGNTISLINDDASPGAFKVYSTNADGTRGWHDAAVGSTGGNIAAVMNIISGDGLGNGVDSYLALTIPSPTPGFILTAATKTLTIPDNATVSGVNSGDQDLSALVPNTRTINGRALSANVTLTEADLSGTSAQQGTDKEFYVSIRTDSKTGAGTKGDPYNASGGLPGTIWATLAAAKPAVIHWVPKFHNIVRIFTAATSDLITSPSHGLVVDDTIRVGTGANATLPAGLSRATTYFVISAGLTVDAFKVSTSSGGSPVDITSTGSGILLWNKYDPANSYQIHGHLPLWHNLVMECDGSTFLLANDYWKNLGSLQEGAFGESGFVGPVGYHDVTFRNGFFDCNNDGQTLPNSVTGMIWLYLGYHNYVEDSTFIHAGSLSTTVPGVEAFVVRVSTDGHINGCEVTDADINTSVPFAAESSLTYFSATPLGSDAVSYHVHFDNNNFHDLFCPEGSAVACINLQATAFSTASFNTFAHGNRINGIYCDTGDTLADYMGTNRFDDWYRAGGATGYGIGITLIQGLGGTNTLDTIENTTFLAGDLGYAAIYIANSGTANSGIVIRNTTCGIYPGDSIANYAGCINMGNGNGNTIEDTHASAEFATTAIRIGSSSSGIITGRNVVPGITIDGGSSTVPIGGDVNLSGVSLNAVADRSHIGAIGATDAVTLTSKRVTPRANTTLPSFSAIAPNADTDDVRIQLNDRAAGTLTINAPTGTPTDGQELLIRISVITGTQTLSWNGIYRGSISLALPSTVAVGSSTYMRFRYNLNATKWDLVNSNTGFSP